MRPDERRPRLAESRDILVRTDAGRRQPFPADEGHCLSGYSKHFGLFIRWQFDSNDAKQFVLETWGWAFVCRVMVTSEQTGVDPADTKRIQTTYIEPVYTPHTA